MGEFATPIGTCHFVRGGADGNFAGRGWEKLFTYGAFTSDFSLPERRYEAVLI